MKEYEVFFVIKKNGCGYVMSDTVVAKNKKEAFAAVEESVRKHLKRHAFYKTTKPPEQTDNGILFDGMHYTRGYGNRLW